MAREKASKQFFIILFIIICILIFIFCLCLWLFFNKREKVLYQEEKGGTVLLNYVSDFNGLSFHNMSPCNDADCITNLKDGTYFDFFIDTKIDEASLIDYEICLGRDKKYSSLDKDIRIYLEEEISGTYTKVFGPSEFVPLKKKSKYGTDIGDMILLHVRKMNLSTGRFRLRMWLSNSAKVSTGDYVVSVKVNGKAT